MRTTVNIAAGNFQAELFLDELPNLRIPNLRKLFKLMFSERNENGETIESIKTWLAENVYELRQELYSAEFEKTHPKSYLDHGSRRFEAAIKRAKTKYAQIYKLQTIFNDFSKKGEMTNV